MISQGATLTANSQLTMFAIISRMSVVIVKTSAVALYQNRTSTVVGNPHQPRIPSHFQATTSDFITTNPKTLAPDAAKYKQQLKENNTVTNHIIRTNIIVGGSRDLEEPQEKMRAKLQQLLQQKQQQQQHYREQQRHHQLQPQAHSQHATSASENAYLLERIDDSHAAGGGGHEQPIYGTWNTKARRPQAPPNPRPTTAGTSTIATSSLQTLIGEVDEHTNDYNHNMQAHHYERLPRRSSTMTPVRRELHDQIPRPPRLTSRQPSLILRRQFSENPMANGLAREDSQRPKPFHFPFEGPHPEEFKKQLHSERDSVAAYGDVQNIQDILKNLHLGGMTASTKTPPLMMMPTGLHISGSYKNLKSSGIANFFRGKRHKKQMQLQFPFPLQMFNGYQAPLIGPVPQAYQSRIAAMDQIYPFKPRSPNDINLLAMQQQYQQNFMAQPSKQKKQKKKQKDKNRKNPQVNSNILLPQYPYATAIPETVYPTLYSPFMAINVTQTPMILSKRVPFKLNLDIFPVLPPSKNQKPASPLTMDEARIVSSMRPPTVLRNPFMEYFTTPVTPTVSALGFYNQQAQRPYNQIRFPGAVQQAQTGASTSDNSNTSPIMLHLNVFPKQKTPSTSPISTNPFYTNTPNDIHRSTVQENSKRNALDIIEPRHQAKSLNVTSQTSIERSDPSSNDQQRDLVDFDHPIVAANDISDLPTPAALVGAKHNEASFATSYNPHTNVAAHDTDNSNYKQPIVPNTQNLEQMASEARTASLFRFPVEDLIQFQVHDAM
ncbi:uncharacterized protein LOC106082364 [Stomoxys calcitrans]|uniref:uncharacterized protein LOC106082364 n=1 Tax=Stomoxys calcitrans TaxID=35570 RepID=UPI0027E28E0D|nr:uncharacterized protein LOC106082364 [Stomoxys calcitrans]